MVGSDGAPLLVEPLVGYHKKGPPKQEPKKSLRPRKYQSQETTTRPRTRYRFSDSSEAPTVRPRTKYRFSASLEAPHVRPRTEYRFSASLEASRVRPWMGNRFSVSLEASHVGPRTEDRFSVSLEAPHVKPRMRCRSSASLEAGSATTPSPLPRPISQTERHVQLTRPTTPTTSAGRRLDTTEWPTRWEVASTPCHPGQDGAGVIGRCARCCVHD